MPFALIIVGVILTISGVKGTSQQLLTLVKGDLQGKSGYIYWMVSILLIGALGYIPALKTFSRVFLALILVVLVLKEGNPQTGTGGGFFTQFSNALALISNPNSVNTQAYVNQSSNSTSSSLFGLFNQPSTSTAPTTNTAINSGI